MQLTTKQEQGLKIAIERYKNKERYTVISGFAGTGKSTLVNFIVEALKGIGVQDEQIGYAAFTGKACQVLQKKGCKNVQTLHKLLYDHRPVASGGFIRIPKATVDYDIIIIDEVSMAPSTLMNLLFTHDIYVICLGDPFQLPPVDKKEDNHLLDTPHIFLDEIMRQAADNDIIRLSMQIREMQPLDDFSKSDNVKIVPSSQLSMGMLQWADQVLVGTNKTRQAINGQMRTALGFEGGPQDGDKVICVRNYWETMDNDGNPLINGAIGTIDASYSTFQRYPKYLSNVGSVKVLKGNFVTDTGMDYGTLDLDEKMLETGEKCLDWKSAYKINKNKMYQGTIPLEFLYGYAITTHKSQGSQWDKVLVIEEKFPFDRLEHARWLYTAVTRSIERVVVVK